MASFRPWGLTSDQLEVAFEERLQKYVLCSQFVVAKVRLTELGEHES